MFPLWSLFGYPIWAFFVMRYLPLRHFEQGIKVFRKCRKKVGPIATDVSQWELLEVTVKPTEEPGMILEELVMNDIERRKAKVQLDLQEFQVHGFPFSTLLLEE